MQSVSLVSPAKLNLYLDVTGKRADGYHNLQTVFERIDLCDRIQLNLRKDGQIRIQCEHPQVPLGPKNIAFQSALLLQKEYGIRLGVDIRIHKNIPVAAGLAGGSSNAATVLAGLNRLWRLSLKQTELVEAGRRIGSDVPFFLYQTSWALGTGRGDEIRPIKIPAKLKHLLVVPKMKMYSREVFTNHKMQLTKKKADVNILIHSLQENRVDAVKNTLFNDLERSILTIQPRLLKLKRRLIDLLGDGVSFSGSGPAVFGILESDEAARKVQQVFEKRYRQVYLVSTY